MFGISGEHILILGVVLLLFGPRRLPELGNAVGKAIRGFKEGISGDSQSKTLEASREQPIAVPPVESPKHDEHVG